MHKGEQHALAALLRKCDAFPKQVRSLGARKGAESPRRLFEGCPADNCCGEMPACE